MSTSRTRFQGARASAGDRPIVLYDGVCGLCTGSVRFIIRRDPGGRFRFASLQSETGRSLATGHGLRAEALDTIILIADGRAFVGSEAALRICRRLDWPWRLLTVFLFVPRPLREPLYRLVARHRYRWFGRLDAEWRPAAKDSSRFL